MDRIKDTVEIASNVPYVAGSASFIIGTLSVNDVAAIVGIVVVIATYFTNLYFKITDRRMNLREKRRRK